MSTAEAYELFPATIASPWFIMLDIFSNVATSIWIIPTTDELDEASPLSSGHLSIKISDETSPFSSFHLSINSGRFLGLVETSGFILLFILNGLVSSRISCRFFSLFSLSSF